MPQGKQGFRFQGEETVALTSVNATQAGEVLYNRLITPQMARRLGVLAGAFQRIKWHECKLRVVPLNGSTVTAGYTAGVVEDPELLVPTSPSDIIPFLTALRATVVRQAWVEDKTGMQVPVADRPEMFTQSGTDIRRYSPGRFVMAAGGNIANGTFQVLLKYDVTLSVPAALTSEGPQESILSAPSVPNSSVSTGGVIMPHTNSTLLGFGETIRINRDLLLSTSDDVSTIVTAPGSQLVVIRAGTAGRFSSVQVQGQGNILTFILDIGQPVGVVYHVLRWTLPGGGQSYISNLVPIGGASLPFTSWVND